LSRWIRLGLVAHRPPLVELTTPKLDLEPGDGDAIDTLSAVETCPPRLFEEDQADRR
jgi:hypothetical protein